MTNPMNLKGRAILVTGAGQGIGKATAELAWNWAPRWR